MNTRNVPTRQKIAVVIFTLTVPLLALDYWQNGGALTFFGAVPDPILYTIAGLGGAISFAFWVEAWGRIIAIVPGAISGVGAFGLHSCYTTWLEKESMHSGESIMIACLGALPGMALCWLLLKILKPKAVFQRHED